MALTTGTSSSYGSEFHFPSGTVVYACQVVGFPEVAMGERNITNHGNGGVEERAPNGLKSVGDFTLSIITTAGHSALFTDQSAKTERTCFLKGKVFSYTFVGWIKSVKEEDADSTNPDSSKLTVVVTPRGDMTVATV
jgi:hypothetical protein